MLDSTIRCVLSKFKDTYLFGLSISLLLMVACSGQANPSATVQQTDSQTKQLDKKIKKVDINEPTAPINLAIHQSAIYLPMLKGKKVAVVANATSIATQTMIPGEQAQQHVVDILLYNKVAVKKIFSPEHGFRGNADAGEKVTNSIDRKTGLPIISLYGDNKKPSQNQLSGIDVLLFDLQDVGVRFYTYISTLHYVMEAVAEAGIPLIILDRPNPNAHYVDGPLLQAAFKSFVGMHPVPVVYGMTIGEYAQMINGEKWLANQVTADITVVTLENYTHQIPYELPVSPSPNLPNAQSIALYPSLCFFEGTSVSVGRGTDFPFQVYGAPYLKNDFYFTPSPNQGAKHPKNQGKVNYGEDLRLYPLPLTQINLSWLIKARADNRSVKTPFWLKGHFIDKLAGTDQLRKQIDQGWTEQQIRTSWQEALERFQQIRRKYLLYP